MDARRDDYFSTQWRTDESRDEYWARKGRKEALECQEYAEILNTRVANLTRIGEGAAAVNRAQVDPRDCS
jgi:hypothetical protein